MKKIIIILNACIIFCFMHVVLQAADLKHRPLPLSIRTTQAATPQHTQKTELQQASTASNSIQAQSPSQEIIKRLEQQKNALHAALKEAVDQLKYERADASLLQEHRATQQTLITLSAKYARLQNQFDQITQENRRLHEQQRKVYTNTVQLLKQSEAAFRRNANRHSSWSASRRQRYIEKNCNPQKLIADIYGEQLAKQLSE